MTMNLISIGAALAEYMPLAQRTEKQLPLLAALRHSGLGMITEIGELADSIKKHVIYEKQLDCENVVEEVGDTFWYVAVALNNLEIRINITSMPEYAGEMSRVDTLQHAALMASYEIGNAVNSIEWYARSGDLSMLTREMSEVTRRLTQHLIVLCWAADVNVAECLTKNIAKLKARYPEKYSNEDALARADKVAYTS